MKLPARANRGIRRREDAFRRRFLECGPVRDRVPAGVYGLCQPPSAAISASASFGPQLPRR